MPKAPRRRNQRQRTRPYPAAQAIRAVHRADRAHNWTPSIVMPKAADVIPSTVMVGIDYATTATATTATVRVEDLVQRVRKILGSNPVNVRMRILQYYIYANVPTASDGLIPSFNVQHVDPITADQGLTIQVRGTLVEPARTAHALTEANRNHLFDWDGTAATSAVLCSIATTSKLELNTFFEIVVYAGVGVAPTDITHSVSELIEGGHNKSWLSL